MTDSVKRLGHIEENNGEVGTAGECRVDVRNEAEEMVTRGEVRAEASLKRREVICGNEVIKEAAEDDPFKEAGNDGGDADETIGGRR